MNFFILVQCDELTFPHYNSFLKLYYHKIVSLRVELLLKRTLTELLQRGRVYASCQDRGGLMFTILLAMTLAVIPSHGPSQPLPAEMPPQMGSLYFESTVVLPDRLWSNDFLSLTIESPPSPPDTIPPPAPVMEAPALEAPPVASREPWRPSLPAVTNPALIAMLDELAALGGEWTRPHWTCIAWKESSYRQYLDGPTADRGFLQITDFWWLGGFGRIGRPDLMYVDPYNIHNQAQGGHAIFERNGYRWSGQWASARSCGL